MCTPVCAHGCMSNNKLNKTIFFYVLFVSYDEPIVSKSLILDEDDQLIKSFDNYYYCVYFWRLIIGCVPAREWRTRLEGGNTIFSSLQVRQWYTLPTVNVNKIIVKKSLSWRFKFWFGASTVNLKSIWGFAPRYFRPW